MAEPTIPLRMKRTQAVDLTALLLKYIKAHHGKEEADKLAPSVQFTQQRKVILDAADGRLAITDKVIDDVFFCYVLALEHAGAHFPIDSGNIGAKFIWSDPNSRTKVQSTRVGAERTAVLYNAGVAYHGLGNHALNTQQDVKLAYRNFQISAGLFEECSKAVRLMENLPAEFSPAYFTALSLAMVCLAHHCVYILATRTNQYKPESLSGLAGTAVALYTEALNALAPFNQVMDKALCKSFDFYKNMFEARAQMHMATKAEQDKECGELLSRLTKAESYYKVAGDLAKDLKVDPRFASMVKVNHDKLLALQTQMKRENDIVYHQRIPDPSSLPHISRSGKSPAKATPLSEIAYFKSGMKDPFGGLVSPEALKAQQDFRQEMSQIVNARVMSVTAGRSELRDSIMASGAEGAAAASVIQGGGSGAQGGLPGDLESRIRGLQAECGTSTGAGFVSRHLRSLFDTLVNVAQSSIATQSELLAQMDNEASADQLLRTEFGPRWTRKDSFSAGGEQREALSDLKQRIDQAAVSDRQVLNKIEGSERYFHQVEVPVENIASDWRALQDAAMKGGVSSGEQQAMEEIAKGLSDFHEGCGKQQEAAEEMQRMLDEGKDNLTSQLCKQKPGNYQSVLEDERQKFSEKMSEIDAFQTTIQTAHQRVMAATQRLQGERAARASETAAAALQGEQKLSDLTHACNKFDEISSNVKEGLNFWGVMSEALEQQRERINGWIMARDLQKGDLLEGMERDANMAQGEAASLALIRQLAEQGEIQTTGTSGPR